MEQYIDGIVVTLSLRHNSIMSKRIAVECPQKYARAYARGHSGNSIGSRISKLPCIGRRHLSREFLIFLLVPIMAVGIIANIYYHIDQLGRPLAIGIMVAAGAVALADATTLGWLWRYERRELDFGSRGKQSARRITMDRADERDSGCCSLPDGSVAQAASQLNKSKITIRLWINEEKLDGEIFEKCRLTGSLPSPRTYHILQEDFDRLIAKWANKP